MTSRVIIDADKCGLLKDTMNMGVGPSGPALKFVGTRQDTMQKPNADRFSNRSKHLGQNVNST